MQYFKSNSTPCGHVSSGCSERWFRSELKTITKFFLKEICSFILQFCSFSRCFLSRLGSDVTFCLWPALTSPGRTALSHEFLLPFVQTFLGAFISLLYVIYMFISQRGWELVKSRDPVLMTYPYLPNTEHRTWHRVLNKCALSWIGLMPNVHFGFKTPAHVFFGLKSCDIYEFIRWRKTHTHLVFGSGIQISYLQPTIELDPSLGIMDHFHSNYFALQYRIAPQHQFRNIFPYS